MSSLVQYSQEGEVACLTLNRADEGNRLTNPMAMQLIDGLDAAKDSPLILLRANGDDFCLGRDMPPPAPGEGINALDVLRDDAQPMISLFEALRRRQQPVIGLVQGKAWGIGTVLAAMCDVTLATSDSSFRLRELERGIPPCIAMAPLLDRIPEKALAYLVYSADIMPAGQALHYGLVSALHPTAELQAATDALVARILGFPPQAVLAVKQYLSSAPRRQGSTAELYGASLLANVLGSR
ncbi:MAG: enoyl-CoA hydratase/isomerase family protein [Pigmentiphaga sp.]